MWDTQLCSSIRSGRLRKLECVLLLEYERVLLLVCTAGGTCKEAPHDQGPACAQEGGAADGHSAGGVCQEQVACRSGRDHQGAGGHGVPHCCAVSALTLGYIAAEQCRFLAGKSDINKLGKYVGEGCAREVVGTLKKPAPRPPRPAMYGFCFFPLIFASAAAEGRPAAPPPKHPRR